MALNTLVYRGKGHSVEDLIDQMIKNPPRLELGDVEVVQLSGASHYQADNTSALAPSLHLDTAGKNTLAADFARSSQTTCPVDPARLTQTSFPVDPAKPVQAPPAMQPVGSAHKGDLMAAGALWMSEYDDLLASRYRPTTSSPAPCESHAAVVVRPEEDGYALVRFDLRQLVSVLPASKGADASDEVVVFLPAYIGDVALRHICAEAFSHRLVQGLRLRFLGIPDTVKKVAGGVFSTLSVENIYVGKGLKTLGEQPCDVAGENALRAVRKYVVHSHNAYFTSDAGDLLSKDGRDLLFLAPPYAPRIAIRPGVVRVGASAFAKGCTLPAAVDCPASVCFIHSRIFDEALWCCPATTGAYRELKRRGVRLASPHASEYKGCWYDFDELGAVLVAGPPKPVSVSRCFSEQAARYARAQQQTLAQQQSAPAPELAQQVNTAATVPVPPASCASSNPLSPAAAAAAAAHVVSGVHGGSIQESDVLVLPHQVAGRSLVRIAPGALPFGLSRVVFPDTVRIIGDNNACRNTIHVVLPAGVQSIGSHCFCSRQLEGLVVVPSSVTSIGQGSFEYACCLLEGTGVVVHLSADQLLSCFLTHPGDGIPFDFESYDALLLSGKNIPDRLGALLDRLVSPFRLSVSVRDALVAQVKAFPGGFEQRVASEGKREVVRVLAHANAFDKQTFARTLELLRRSNRSDCVAYLMQWHHEQNGSVADNPQHSSIHDRFAL